MYEIIDKILLFLCSTALYLLQTDARYAIIPVIIVILLSNLFQYFESGRIWLAGNLLFAVICIFNPGYIVFMPVLLYHLLHTKYQYAATAVFFLFLVNMDQYTLIVLLFTTIFLIASYLLKYKTDKLNSLRAEYNDLRDTSSSFSQLMEEKNRSIQKNQDYEINLATLNERNRISKEIHDNIGHMLSCALLQVGALLTIEKEDAVKTGLSDLRNSLSSGMDDIRNSIHKIYDESIDLFSQTEQIVKNFTFCPVTFEYDINNQPPLMLKHCLLAIMKEALTNIMKHSDATKASIILREHPAMYQLIIQDNGTMTDNKKAVLYKSMEQLDAAGGMGLQNISDRVKGFDGNMNITMDKGFKLFISIPKKYIMN